MVQPAADLRPAAQAVSEHHTIMKLKHTLTGTTEEVSCSDLASIGLTSPYEGGQLENIQDTTEKTRDAFGRLLDILLVRGMINETDVLAIIDTWQYKLE